VSSSEQDMRERFRQAESDFMAHRIGRPPGDAWMERYSQVVGAAIAWGCEIGINVYRENAHRDVLRQASVLKTIPVASEEEKR
jgi:hypothetical protein